VDLREAHFGRRLKPRPTGARDLSSLAGSMQTNHHRPRIEKNDWVINFGSLLAGDFSSAIASKLASYNCINPA
jgi:hypothetical protein